MNDGADIQQAIVNYDGNSAGHSSENDIFYRRLIEASPDPIFIYVDERIVFANRAAAKLLAADQASEIIGRSVWDFSPPESMDGMRKGIDLLITGKRRYILADDRVRRLDGEVINIEISTSFFPYDGKPGVLAFLRDITKRYRAEENLKRSENIYRTIFETTGTAMIFFGEDTIISLANSECLSLSGYTKDEVEGKMSWTKFIADEDIPRLMESHSLRNIDPEKAPRNQEFRLKHRSGRLHDVYMTIAMIPGTSQRVASLVDISDRKRAERALAASEEKYRLVVENAKEAITIIQNERVMYLNPKICEITGYDEKHILGRKFFEFVHPDSRDYTRSDYHKRLEMRQAGSGRPIKVVDVTGKTRWLDIYSVPIIWEDKKAVLVFLNDITDRKLAEEALQASEERYRLLAENAGDIILVCSMDGTITYVNSAGCEISGLSREEIEGKKITDIIITERKRELMKVIVERRIAEHRVYRNKAEIINKDGDRVQIETISNLVRLDNEKEGVLILARDITERNRLEREIINVSERIRLQVGRDLHDDVSPHIIAIGAFAKVLARKLEKQGIPESKEVEKIRELLGEASLKLKRLVKGLCPVDLDARGVLSAIENLTERIQNMYGLQCNFSYDSSIMIHDNTVATSLYYIAQEAVYNAAKHANAKRIEITLFPDADGNYRLQVIDDGTGLPPSTARRRGQGLKIMRYRSEIINGVFEINKNRQSGTIVSCTIPAASFMNQEFVK